MRFFQYPDRRKAKLPIFNITRYYLNLPTTALMKARDPRITIPPTFHFFNAGIPLPCRRKLRLTVSVTHPYQHKHWNVFISRFYCHTIYVKIHKINSFLPTQLPNILTSQLQTHSQTHQHYYLNIFVSFVVNTIIRFSLVLLSFDLQLCVLSVFCNHTLVVTCPN